MTQLTYLEAVVMGAVQGVAELFPVSSLGHAILIPAVVGGSWAADLSITAPHSPYLAFVVSLHVATALALIVFYRRDWVVLLAGLGRSVRRRRIETPQERLIWLLIAATIPVGIAGLIFDHLLRAALGAPIVVACFLTLNGIVLIVGQRVRGSAALEPAPAGHAPHTPAITTDARIAHLSVTRAVLVGASQIAALFPGISRSGAVMVAGRRAGLDGLESARFAFLLATPAILAAGLLEIPSLAAPVHAGLLGPILAGNVTAFVAALLAVRFLDRYFAHRSLYPFAVYCVVAGVVAGIVLIAR